MTSLRVLGRKEVLAAGGGDFVAMVGHVRRVLGLLRDGRAQMPPELSVPLGREAPQAHAYALPARVEGPYAAAGVKWTAHRPPAGDGLPAIMSLTLVNDLATGRPLGAVESALLTAIRTACVSALALRNCAPAPVRRLALLGAGQQARTHLRMLAALFPDLQLVRLWNRSPGRAEAMAAWTLPWPVRAEATPLAALADADAVLACTAAAEPYLGPEAMAPGRILLQIGYHEATFDAIDRADAVVVDLWGDFARTSAKSLFRMHRAGRFPQARVAADLATAVLDGWNPRPDAAVYFSSFGLNVFDVALAAVVLRRAEALGLGTSAPLLPDGEEPET